MQISATRTIYFLIIMTMTSIASASTKYLLEGGSCADDTFRIVQKISASKNGVPTYNQIPFSNECAVVNRINSVESDYQPAIFECKAGGVTPLAGARYQYQRRVILKSHSEEAVDTRVYIYKCVKSCSKALKEIKYYIYDCG